ncbi:MAG: DNA polymerase III subunit gamma/tau [Lachnospiraceae bacterium]|nr:DNA polymerase III subunit gamma/tau [Lachnospiraceae bacterium]
MSYTALYRKFRPQEFEDVKGQEHIVTTLKNQIKANRIGHAYLFCGTRGTGKTTVAKILAKAVNCTETKDGSPCGTCAVCQTISQGTSLNVIEIDAASNNGVDNIRQIRDEVTYRPTEGKYRVYIIDEVHMLSAGAFNALLKTLEEPPSYVIFILATTEAHKIPITILSRCQRYDFHRISIDTIANRLMELMRVEQVEVEEKAIRYIAKAGDGSMRDALSLLDQCIAFHLGETLTYENVLEVLGAVDTEVFSKLLRQILAKDIVGAIASLDILADKGREMGQFVTDFTWYLRNLLLIQSSDEMEDALDMSRERIESLKEEAKMVKPEVLIRYIRIFSELGNQIKYEVQKRILIEIAIIKLCKPEMEKDYEAIIDRIASIEAKLAHGIPMQVVANNQHSTDRNETWKLQNDNSLKEQRDSMAKVIPEDIEQVMKHWKPILSEIGAITKTYLKKAVPSLGSNQELLLMLDDENAYEYLSENRSDCITTLKTMIAKRIGKDIEVVIRKNESGRSAKETVPDLREFINFDIEIEDEF